MEFLNQLDFDTDSDPAENVNCLPDVLAKLENYFNPRRNLLYEWYVIMSTNQIDCEPIETEDKRKFD